MYAGDTNFVMLAATTAATFDLKLHIRKIRAELGARGIWIDDELDDALVEMMQSGREAAEAGGTPLDDPAYRAAAARLHRLVREREVGVHVPQIANYRFPALRSKIDELNRALRKRTRFPPGLYKLVDLANRANQSEDDIRTYLREVEWHLRLE